MENVLTETAGLQRQAKAAVRVVAMAEATSGLLPTPAGLLLAVCCLVPGNGRFVTTAVLTALRGYQRRLTTFTPCCPQPMSCSDHGVAMVRWHGARAGLMLAAHRIRDCGRPRAVVAV